LGGVHSQPELLVMTQPSGRDGPHYSGNESLAQRLLRFPKEQEAVHS